MVIGVQGWLPSFPLFLLSGSGIRLSFPLQYLLLLTRQLLYLWHRIIVLDRKKEEREKGKEQKWDASCLTISIRKIIVFLAAAPTDRHYMKNSIIALSAHWSDIVAYWPEAVIVVTSVQRSLGNQDFVCREGCWPDLLPLWKKITDLLSRKKSRREVGEATSSVYHNCWPRFPSWSPLSLSFTNAFLFWSLSHLLATHL